MNFSVLDPSRAVCLHLVIPSRIDEVLMQTLLPGSRHIFGSYLHLFILPVISAIFTTEGKERRFPIFFITSSKQKTIIQLLGGKCTRQCSRHRHYSDLSIKATLSLFFPWWDWQLGMGRTPSMDTIWHNGALTTAGPRARNLKTNINKTGRRNLSWAPLPACPTPVYSHILRHYFKSRWCSVVEQTSNYPSDTLQGLPTCDCKKLLHPKLRAVVWLFSIIGCNQV